MKAKAAFHVIAVIMMTLALPRAMAAETLTLKEALDRAAGESPRVMAREAAADASSKAVQEANAAFLPKLAVSETFMRTNDPVGVFSAKLDQAKFTAADFNLPQLNDPKSINNWTTRVELAVPAFHSGVDWAQRRAALEQNTSSEKLADFERSRVRFAVMKLYYTAVAMAEQRLAVNEGIRRLRALEGSYQLMEAPTSASTTSYLVAKSVRTGLDAEAVRLECRRKQALRDLNAVMGVEPDTELALTDPLPAVVLAQGSDVPAKSRADIEASAAGVRAAGAERDAAARRWGPDVDLFGAYNLYTGNFDGSNGSYEVGARLSWQVFDWGRQARTARSGAVLEQAQQMHRAAELSAAADLATAASNIRSCAERYRIVSQAVGTASEAVGQATTRYAEGTLPLMDYSQTIQNWVNMRQRLIENHLDFATAQAEYDFQRGAL